MDRSPDAANWKDWQERLVALALVATVGLATQFVVERTLPAPTTDRPAVPAGLTALEAASWEAARSVLPTPGSAENGARADSENAASDAISSLSAEHVSAGGVTGHDEVQRARRVRTRNRRFLPTQRAETRGELPGSTAPRVALGAPPAGWTDLTAPLRVAGEPSIEVAALLVPMTSAVIATVPGPAQPLMVPLEIGDELEAKIGAGGTLLILRDRGGNVIEERGAPTARDGTGRPLPARYHEQDGVPHLRIDPSDAHVPIEVCPGSVAPGPSAAPEPSAAPAPSAKAKLSS